MKHCVVFLFLLLLCLFGRNKSSAQSIEGTWTGNYKFNLLMPPPQKLVVELYLYQDSLLTGASHLYYRNEKYEHYTLKGIYHAADSSLEFTEDSTIGVKLGFLATNCLGKYTTKLSVGDTTLRLEGRWKDKSKSILGCPSSGVWLEKPISKKQQPKQRDQNLDRPMQIQSLYEIPAADKDSIRIEVLDNADIDGDIISLYVNDSTLAQKQRIGAKPLIYYVSLSDENPIQNIQMVAESMGSTPPCTALMIITTTAGKRYETTLSSSFQTNAGVKLFLKE